MNMSECPEHDKLDKIHDKSQAIGEFLDWLQNERDIVLAEYHEHAMSRKDVLLPAHINIETLLGEFFEIGPEKLENEKLNMLEQLRAAQQKG